MMNWLREKLLWIRSKLLWVAIAACLVGAAIREILLQLFGV